ncbi:MAG: hypothetical protein AAB380_01370, partial [Verrucomicrobiota bacterium]
MLKKPLLMLMTAAIATSCCTMTPNKCCSDKSPAGTPTLADFQMQAKRFKNVIRLPEFETTPAALQASLDKTIATANAGLDRVGKLAPSEVNFGNTLLALDDISYEAGLTANRLGLI